MAQEVVAKTGRAEAVLVDPAVDPAKEVFARPAKRVFVGSALASLFFTFFPADCRICNAPLIKVSRLPVCDECLASVRPLAGSFCAVCSEAVNLPGYADQEAIDREQTLCSLCRRAQPPFVRAVAYGSYEGELRDLIHLLKFEQIRPVAAVLGAALAKAIGKLDGRLANEKPSLGAVFSEKKRGEGIAVIPVPLHKRKQAQRGFNQAELIAREALKQMRDASRFELLAGVLVRQRETGSQIGLTRHQRRVNLRGAFAVSDATQIRNRDILLIDDVLTTGTTAAECTRVLLRAGAARVWVATVARTLKIADAVRFSLNENAGDLSVEQGVQQVVEEGSEVA
jgi:ComF family protein